MKNNPYHQLMTHIHPPEGLNEQVLQAAQGSAPVSPRPLWQRTCFRLAVCTACVLLLAVGTIHFRPVDREKSSVALPHWDFVLTACAAQGEPPSPQPPDLSFTVEQSGAAEGCCLFQIESDQAVSLRLSMQGGELYAMEADGRLSPLARGGDNRPLDHSPHQRFGFRLTDEEGFLTIEVSFPDGSVSRKTYRLFAESSAQDPAYSGLHDPLFSQDARPLSQRVRAVDAAELVQLSWPLEGEKTITAPFGTQNSPVPSSVFHSGIDLSAPSGTPILAAADGKVVECGFDEERGHYLVLDHGNGLSTAYHHCARLSAALDQRVKAGEAIGEVGSSGLSTGAHLHFAVLVNGRPENPLLHFSWESMDGVDYGWD